MINSLLVAFGLAVLLGGGDLLLRGATKIAQSLGMSRLLIGLTIISLGTSAPETAICIDAALKGTPEIALGNIIGSNVANILLILGITAVVIPIVIQKKIIQREVPLMIGVSLGFLVLVLDGQLTRFDGITLLTGMLGFMVWQFWSAKKESDAEKIAHAEQDTVVTEVAPRIGIFLSLIFIVIGIAMLWFGAGWMVQGAKGLATSWGISELVIGLTIVAIGSSAPEIVTSLLAAKQGYPEMAVGSVIGSNIANLLLVGGLTTTISSSFPVPAEAFEFDIPVMIVAAIACLPIFASGHRIDRWEGALFLFCFAAFTCFLFFRVRFTEVFPNWNQMVWPIATPLIVATVGVLIFRWFRPKETPSEK